MFCSLTTPFEKNTGDVPFGVYPRPQLKRDSFFCLNGKWTLDGEEITVPYPPNSRLSGIKGYETFDKDNFKYEKRFTLPESFNKGRLILHFGACDQICRVFVNGKCAGEHTGGYLPFSFDITEYASDGENVLNVEVTDTLDKTLPYGKQKKKRGGMWYTPVSGIWQSVWIESVPDSYIKSIKITPDLKGATVEIFGCENEEKTLVCGDIVCKTKENTVRIEPETPHLWTCDDPFLYDFTLTTENDGISSYFALRSVGVDNSKNYPILTLNGKPFFANALLDQGYFSDGIYLPASPEGFENDILTAKRLGFNTLRKHIKVEPDIFYYYCDKYGMVVFQDMVNNGVYNFIYDTALPTVFMKRALKFANKKTKENFKKHTVETVNTLYNHPCIVLYTVFNEGWGQHSSREMYEIMKKLDKTRLCDTASGWFKTKYTDIESPHIYFKPVKLPKRSSGKVRIISEFGGYSYPVKDHVYNPEHSFGYKSYKNEDELTKALVSLYEDQIIPHLEKGLCGTVLTQLSDVEDETNGIMTYDRRIVKPDEKAISECFEKLFKRFEEING